MNALLRYASPLVAAAALATSCGAAAHSLLDPVEVVPVHADLRDATEVLFEPRQPRTPGTVEFSARFALHPGPGARFAMRVEDCPESFAFSINDIDLSHSPSDASLVDITPQMRVGMNDVVLTFRSYPHGAARPRGILFETRADFLPATVDGILAPDRFRFSHKPSCVVTGVVVYAHPHINDTAILADVARPNGRGMYVTGAFPERPKSEHSGFRTMAAGDIVEVRGFVDPMLVHAGIVASHIRKIGQMKLPPPPLTGLSDLKRGVRSNTRARFEGTVGDVRIVNIFGHDLPELELETPGGTLLVHGVSEEDCRRHHGERVFADGVVMPYISTSGIELFPVLEAAGGGAIHPVPLSRKWIARTLAACRFAAVLVPLPLLVVIAVLVFDRRQRKVRAKAIAAERRRIAAELHDSVSQYLSGTRILLDTVRSAESTLPDEQREALSTASEMLNVSRDEVRNAIHNLRNDDILTMRIDELLGLHARRVRAATCVAVETDLERMPSDLAPKVKGDVLAVVQEAVTNAIRHGKATKLRIESKRNGADGYVVRVLNDGLPFDASRAPGSSAGHFGIDSMHERGERSGFAVSFGEEDGWNFVELKGKAGR